MRISDWSSDVCSSDLAGVRLQIALPRARVIYVSATGATKPENLSYTARLGLWGPGTAFRDRDAFLAAMEEGGIAAMELVARDTTAMGLYQARALSFAGVERAGERRVGKACLSRCRSRWLQYK